MKRLPIVAFTSLSLCLAACATLTPTTTNSPSPTASPSQLQASAIPTPAASPNPSPSPTPAATVAPSSTPQPSSSPLLQEQPLATATGKPSQDLSVVKSVEVEILGKRFLDGEGESTQFKAILKDANGQTLNSADFPLEWLSTRPKDFSIDNSGKIVALTDYGYTFVTLRVKGTDLEFKQLLSVNAPVASITGGSTPTPAPVIPAPAVTSRLPVGGTAGNSVVITGTNLNNATAVNFGSTAATSFTVDSATQITATVPVGTGTVDITVTTAGGTSAILGTAKFSYTLTKLTFSWPADQVKTRTTNITGPANVQQTSFTGYSGPWNYHNYPFTVPVSGSYTFTAETTPVTNTSWILKGLFSPGNPTPATPLANFMVAILAGGAGPFTGNFNNITLEAGQQYTFLTAFNTGGSPADKLTVTFAGPDGAGVIPTNP